MTDIQAHSHLLSALWCYFGITQISYWCGVYSVFSWILIWCVLTWYLFWCTVNLCYHAGLEKLRGQIATQIFLLFFDSQCVEDIFATKGTVIYCLAPVCPCIYPFFLLYCIQGHFRYMGHQSCKHYWPRLKKKFRSRWRWAVRWWRKWCLTKAKIYLPHPQYISKPVSLLEW